MISRLLLTVLGIVVAAAIIGGGYLFLHHNQPTASSNQQPTPSTATATTQTPASSPQATPTLASGVNACSPSDLSLSIGSPQGAAGTMYYTILFTNTSEHICTLTGYPGVQLAANGQNLGSPASRNPSMPVSPITLQHGQAATANLGVPNSGNFPAGSCSAVSTTLRVYPPNTTAALTVPFTQAYCPGFSVSAVHQ